MKILKVELHPPQKRSYLAGAKITLADDEGSSIIIDDLRLLKNIQGQTWVGFPAHRVVGQDGVHEYRPTVIFDHHLRRAVQDAVLVAYEQSLSAGGVR